jgi:hypothetical protein
MDPAAAREEVPSVSHGSTSSSATNTGTASSTGSNKTKKNRRRKLPDGVKDNREGSGYVDLDNAQAEQQEADHVCDTNISQIWESAIEAATTVASTQLEEGNQPATTQAIQPYITYLEELESNLRVYMTRKDGPNCQRCMNLPTEAPALPPRDGDLVLGMDCDAGYGGSQLLLVGGRRFQVFGSGEIGQESHAKEGGQPMTQIRLLIRVLTSLSDLHTAAAKSLAAEQEPKWEPGSGSYKNSHRCITEAQEVADEQIAKDMQNCKGQPDAQFLRDDSQVIAVAKEHFERERDQFKTKVDRRLEAVQQKLAARERRKSEEPEHEKARGFFADKIEGGFFASQPPRNTSTRTLRQELQQLQDAQITLAELGIADLESADSELQAGKGGQSGTNRLKTSLCKHYQSGKCRHGSACNFAHGRSELRNTRPGDWECPACNANVYASNSNCFKCGTGKPPGTHGTC